MRHPWYARLVALALTLVMTFELLPTRIWATDLKATPNDTEAFFQDSEELQEEPVSVTGEVDGNCGAKEKHYRLSDGSYIAVDYGMPVTTPKGTANTRSGWISTTPSLPLPPR